MDQKQKSLLSTLFTVTLILFLFHLVATYFELYWTVWWIDLINHTLGGIVATLIAIVIWQRVGQKRNPTTQELILFVFLIGVGWELFEVTFGLVLVDEPGYITDSLLDVVMDMFGLFLSKVFLLKTND